MAITGREQITQLIKLAINYGLDRIEHIYSTLLLLAIQPLVQKSIAVLSEIILVDFIVVRIRILHLNFTLIQAYTSRR